MFLCRKNLDKPIVTISSPLLHYHLYDTATIICQACSIPLPTVFDIFHPKHPTPLTNEIKERTEKPLNQTCRQLTILIHVNILLFQKRHY